MPADEEINPVGLALLPSPRIVLDMFVSSVNVGGAERQSEAGHGDGMQAVRRLHDAGNGHQAAAWLP
jgi:hypothetical protein